jgi:prepilin-type N-terminal cleavage/methylation domain-containing protein
MTASDSGYTILETLVALVILATVLVALYAAGGSSLDLIGRSDALQQATLLAQSKLDELAADRGALPAASEGTFGSSGAHWRVVAHDIPSHLAAASPYRLQDVALTVSWPVGARTQDVTLNTRHLGLVRP